MELGSDGDPPRDEAADTASRPSPAGRQWAAYLTAVVGAEVARYRRERGIKSAARMATLCKEHGLAIDRSTIAKMEAAGSQLEKARSAGTPLEANSISAKVVTVTELLVLARVLDVAPDLLIAPVGHAQEVEIVPGVSVAPIDAYYWMTGQQPMVAVSGIGMAAEPVSDDYSSAMRATALIGRHRGELSRWEAHRRDRNRAMELGNEAKLELDQAITSMDVRADILRGLRGEIRSFGLLLPPIPAELASALGEVQD